jgi:two-component system sensor histidine kinase MprB
MADRVEATVATLRRFVGDAAHELHTPLTALRTDLELVADTDDPAARLDLLDRAQAQVTRLATLTSGLLDLSRIEAEAARPKRQPIDLAGLVQELSEVYASRAEQAGIAFSLDAPDGPVTVQGNEEQLRRALGNLLDNAIKFTPAGGQVGVALRRADTAIELQVEDSGIGVPEDDLPQLFGRFHRGRNASTYPGNGVGLAIVRAIVETHGGSVTAENLAQGARFSLRLPVG